MHFQVLAGQEEQITVELVLWAFLQREQKFKSLFFLPLARVRKYFLPLVNLIYMANSKGDWQQATHYFILFNNKKKKKSYQDVRKGSL